MENSTYSCQVNLCNRYKPSVVKFAATTIETAVGERAVRAQASSQLDQARSRQVQAMDRVGREIAEVYAQVKMRRRPMAAAQAGVEAAMTS